MKRERGGVSGENKEPGDRLLMIYLLGFQVRVLDNLSAQVHGDGGQAPAYLSKEIELIVGELRIAL